MSLKKFVDALPIPPVLKAKGKREGIPYYEVTMKQVKQKLLRDLPPTTIWGYNGMFPGPTFDVRRNHPIQPGHEPPPVDSKLPNPSVVPEFFGNTILVNGKVWPYLEVEPRKYRFRILNGSNARFYNMQLSSGQDFIQIGTDGGLLEKPIRVSEMILAPAERVDIIIDFSKVNGRSIILTNNAKTPFPNGQEPSDELKQIMQFRIKQKLSKPDKSKIPVKLSCLEQLNPRDSVNVRKNILMEDTDHFGRPKPLLNNLNWDQPQLTESPYNGTIEIESIFGPSF